jgi:hypothetical protein
MRMEGHCGDKFASDQILPFVLVTGLTRKPATPSASNLCQICIWHRKFTFAPAVRQTMLELASMNRVRDFSGPRRKVLPGHVTALQHPIPRGNSKCGLSMKWLPSQNPANGKIMEDPFLKTWSVNCLYSNNMCIYIYIYVYIYIAKGCSSKFTFASWGWSQSCQSPSPRMESPSP